jgi:hypothetical protein
MHACTCRRVFYEAESLPYTALCPPLRLISLPLPPPPLPSGRLRLRWAHPLALALPAPFAPPLHWPGGTCDGVAGEAGGGAQWDLASEEALPLAAGPWHPHLCAAGPHDTPHPGPGGPGEPGRAGHGSGDVEMYVEAARVAR